MTTPNFSQRKAVFTCIGASNYTADDYQREINDFHVTDPLAVTRLLEVEKFQPVVYEPCCGLGHISKELSRNGYSVVSTDLIDRGFGQGNIDFLTLSKLPCKCDIVTNPPYRYAQEFVEKSLELLQPGDKVAMLLKLTFLESQSRKQLFLTQPFKTLYVFSKRISCYRDGDFSYRQGAIAYGWYVWEKGFKGNPIVKWIN